MAAKKTSGADSAPLGEKTVHVAEIQVANQEICVIGLTPYIHNRMGEKAKRDLVWPRGRLNSAEKQINIKHNMPAEFRASPHRPAGLETLLGLKATAFKGVMATAALDMPGAKKAQIGRLVHVVGEFVPIWGVPTLGVGTVKSADINRTPDIRTWAIMRRWASRFTVRFVTPIIRRESIINLLNGGGFTVGVGDGRPEKGKLAFGQFRVCNDNDPEFLEIVATGDREVQVLAMESPEFYDEESQELFEWWQQEARRRGVSLEEAA